MLRVAKARSFLCAVWSFFWYGDAPLVDHDRRQAICLRCEHLEVTATGVFCKACGCPHWAVSDLRTKWRMRDIKCPLDKW
jgi:hypothetical protein